MEKILHTVLVWVCLSGLAVAFNPRPAIVPPSRHPHCFHDQLLQDRDIDLSFVCNDGTPYPEQEIEDALYYAEDYWRIYLNLTSTCFQEKDNFFTNSYSEKDFYNLDSVCTTKRSLIRSVYSHEHHVCHVVRPRAQKVYHAQCGGVCNLGYAGVTGYHCIPRGFTYRKFLVYCQYLPDYPATSPLECSDPYMGPLDPRELTPSYRMQNVPVSAGVKYERTGYFTEFQATMPTYCGCRGYFCR